MLLLQWLSDAANKKGYALGVHGSLSRDLDLIAAPWTEDAVCADQLIAALVDAAGGFIISDGLHVNPEARAHGRMAYAIQLGRGLFIDVSVMPRKGDAQVSMYGDVTATAFPSPGWAEAAADREAAGEPLPAH